MTSRTLLGADFVQMLPYPQIPQKSPRTQLRPALPFSSPPALWGAVSQWERDAIGERTRDALDRKKRNGERMGNIQFGYRLAPDGKHVEPDTVEQAVLREIGRLRLVASDSPAATAPSTGSTTLRWASSGASLSARPAAASRTPARAWPFAATGSSSCQKTPRAGCSSSAFVAPEFQGERNSYRYCGISGYVAASW